VKRDVQYSMNTGVSLRNGPHRVFPSVHIIVYEDSFLISSSEMSTLVLLVLALPLSNGLRTATTNGVSSKSITCSRSAAVRMDAAVGSPIEMTVDLPPRGKAKLRFKRLLPSSEGIVVKYSLPCALNVENRDGRAVCTKDGAGGEKVGDVLRYCTQWSLGLPSGDGAITTAASFAGAISWQLGLFDGTVAYPSCAELAHN